MQEIGIVDTTPTDITYEVVGIKVTCPNVEDIDVNDIAEEHLKALMRRVIEDKHMGLEPFKESLKIWDRLSSGFLYELLEENILGDDDHIVIDTIIDEKLGER